MRRRCGPSSVGLKGNESLDLFPFANSRQNRSRAARSGMPASSSASANAPADDEFVAWYRRDFASTTSYEDDLNELLSDIFAILQEPLDLGDNSTDDDDARVLERWGTWDERKWERWKVTPAELETIKRMRECLRVVEDPEKCRVDHDGARPTYRDQRPGPPVASGDEAAKHRPLGLVQQPSHRSLSSTTT